MNDKILRILLKRFILLWLGFLDFIRAGRSIFFPRPFCLLFGAHTATLRKFHGHQNKALEIELNSVI